MPLALNTAALKSAVRPTILMLPVPARVVAVALNTFVTSALRVVLALTFTVNAAIAPAAALIVTVGLVAARLPAVPTVPLRFKVIAAKADGVVIATAPV